MTSTSQQQTSIHPFLIITYLSIALGLLTPSLLESLRYHPSEVHHDKVAILGYTVNESVKAYRDHYRTFPDPSRIALLSTTATHLQYSVEYFESPNSEGLVEGLRNAST